MSIESNCPSCGTKVRVPETLLGKSVKCPKCKAVFTAQNPDPGFEEVAEDEPRPRRRPARDYEEDDFDDRPRRPARRGRSYARSAISAPAIGLLISGILGLILAVFGIGATIVAVVMIGNQPGIKIDMPIVAGRVAGSILNLALSGLLVANAQKMKRLESRGSARTACILGMLPCAGCCFVGLPFGIWGLVVMNNPDVERAFEG